MGYIPEQVLVSKAIFCKIFKEHEQMSAFNVYIALLFTVTEFVQQIVNLQIIFSAYGFCLDGWLLGPDIALVASSV